MMYFTHILIYHAIMLLVCKVVPGGWQSSGKLKTSLKKKSASSQTEEGEENGDVVAIGAKDTSMFLFRALGKILYCKSE